MALNSFRQRDIEQMDVHNIPEKFITYFESLDDSAKAELVGSRPDLATALGFVLPESDSNENEEEGSSSDSSFMENQETGNAAASPVEESGTDDAGEDDEEFDELAQIRHNFYEGKDLDVVIRNNMPELEALAIPDGATTCMIHRTPLEKKEIRFTSASFNSTYGVFLWVCRECHRVYMEESKMPYRHDFFVQHGINHTFYDLDLTTDYLRSQMPVHQFSEEEVVYVPDTWIDEDPRCPIHDEELYEVPCLKRYKEREIQFTAFRCDKCGKYLMRRAEALDLKDQCAEIGIPQIEIQRIVKKQPEKKPIPPKNIHSDYLIENGQRSKFRYDVTATSSCYQLSEKDTVVVSDSIYCNISGHNDTEEVAALIRVLQKRDGRKAYLFRLGYCEHCQKYYMSEEDYKVLYPIGRPEVTILRDIEDADYQITSGEVFNLERDHLDSVEKKITDEVNEIFNSADYVSPYATGSYDDGGLASDKEKSQAKYGPRLEELSSYEPKPYSYRVDISLDGSTETYYVGAADIYLDGEQQVISANSVFGHDLINYQTIKVQKDGKEYDIKLSRQFDINDAKLYGYVNLRTDEDIIFKSGITDPFLVRVLNMRKRQHNLTDIFVTIQENQNRIVNTPFSTNIIVQGCAGSGKTMVLLHRLSSLNYKERGFRFSENALILTPNDQFTLHIKGLAEELQIGNIPRVSVEQYYIDTLLHYSQDFKLDGKVSSEMIVRQGFVDYVYSDQFRKEFSSAYDYVIERRNELTETLNYLQEATQQSSRPIDFSDDTRVIPQIKYAADSIRSMVERRESEITAAVDDHKQLVSRKQFLEGEIPAREENTASIVWEALGRAKEKISAFLSKRQSTVTELEEQIEALKQEHDAVQKKFNPFGKKEKLEELEKKIKAAERKINTENARQEEELPILNATTEGLSEDELLAWMRQVSLIVPEVRDEVRLITNLREDIQALKEELSGIDKRIEAAAALSEEKQASRYSDEIKKGIQYLYSEIEKYTTVGIYQLVFDYAVDKYRKEHNVLNIQGKYHRYDLYARLLFAMRYYGKAIGTTRFMCIDEGQDLALNEYRLIQELNQNRITINVFGDTNQLMKPGRGITDWSELKRDLGAETYELNENYRNTNQITRFCNRSFDMNVTLTGVDGVNVREIPRKELENELALLKVTTERIAILVPRGVQKTRYLKTELLPASITQLIGDRMENGFISLMYVDEVKGIEFDKAYVVGNKMSRNEKYIAYTRALSELILVVDNQVADYDDGSSEDKKGKKVKASKPKKKKKTSGILNYKSGKSLNQERIREKGNVGTSRKDK